ncbi:MAG: type II toxin-antitoxin system VapC family toxin [Thermoleophilaceae bacterium]|nr:type II toxin-antitoxin system VapC family toxin [Thermoleophilaceae bacterium]
MRVYFDSSALVKLFVSERGSEWCTGVWNDATNPFSSSLAYAEVRAALGAAARAGRVKSSDLPVLKARFEQVWEEIGELECDPELIRHAGEVAEFKALRGYDAIHLSTAMALNAVQPVYMLTWDDDLAEASFDAGINVIRTRGA